MQAQAPPCYTQVMKYDYNIFARGRKSVHRAIIRRKAKEQKVSEAEIVRRAIEAF